MQDAEKRKIKEFAEIKRKIKEFAEILRQAVFQNKKVLCVVGSGCSAEAGIKISQEIKDELNFGFSENEIRAILKQCGLVVPFSDIPMEAYLSAYQHIFGPAWEDIDTRLRKFFPTRNDIDPKIIKKPPLTYALLAHLMKYNFIHSIISLNFDELLERALDDSLGISGYKIVSSRSAFGTIRDFKLYNDTRVLYKPHGTISAPMTLRATWDRVNRLDDEKIEVLSEVLKNHSVWIFIGYKFGDLDIAPIFLYSALNKTEVSIWFVNRDSHNRLYKDPRIKQLLKKNASQAYDNYFIKSNSDYFFRKLINNLFDTNIEPKMKYYRQGNGYRILDILFEGGLEPSLINQIIYRIFLFSLITKGKFTSKALLQFNEIKNLLFLYSNQHNQDISSSLREVLDLFLKEFNALFSTDDQGIYKIFYLNNKNDLFADLVNFLKNKLSINSSGKKEKKVKELLEKLWNDTDIMILEEPTDIPFPLTDQGSKVICNLEELLTKTEKIINEAEANGELAIVAETGEWICKYIDEIRKRSIKIKLIISDPECDLRNSYHYRNGKNIETIFKSLGNNIEYRYLPFIENSNHMTLSLGKKKGIFFNREAKSPFINPIFISGDDFNRAETYFQILWEKKASKDKCKEKRCRDPK